MKPLEERVAARKEQKEENRKESNLSPTEVGKEDISPFSAKKFLSGKVEDITGGIKNLNKEQFEEVVATEKAGKNRASVLGALSTASNEKNGAASGWQTNV